ncbi:response regulator [Ideonella sp.]|uniref:hybrid sensor histidine kinase/response regulator n=1 Tax=Ideonella sp. TaxID=1929293 RepID=UPI0035AF43D0
MTERQFSLLLVDDDPSAVQAMSRMLADYTNQRFATSGADALRVARESPPDLILLDAEMPGMSGLEVCKALRADSALAHIPVIFATSHDSAELEVAALQSGAVDFVTKPIAETQLRSRVRARLRTHQALHEPAAAARHDVLQPPERPSRLLIVDDEVNAIHVLSQTLSQLGELHYASSGEEALRIAPLVSPDIILLDIHMPGIDGFAVCGVLKALPDFASVPIVFVTRHSEPEIEMRALDLGAAEFIAKPYTPAVLRARVRNLLHLKHRTDADLRAVSERWQRVSDARVAGIVEAATDAILTIDTHQRLVLMNGAACRLFGVQPDEVMGHPVRNVLGSLLDDLSVGGAAPVRLSLPFSGDGAVTVEMSVSTSDEGAQRLTTVVLRDVSDRERLDRETQARAEAEATAQIKARMLAYLAHEIGNPLNGIIGFGQLMAADTELALHPVQRQRLAHLLSSARHLQTLMRDALDLGRFESGQLAFEIRDIDVSPLLTMAIEASQSLAAEHRVELRLGAQSTFAVWADSSRLQQVLLNLLSNAVKYNRAGGRVDVEASRRASTVAIAIRDSGLGMDAEQRKHLFEPFNRLGRQGSGTPGAGLGLLITRQLVEAMGGQLEVDSIPGSGSCFTVLLPSADSPRPD